MELEEIFLCVIISIPIVLTICAGIYVCLWDILSKHFWKNHIDLRQNIADCNFARSDMGEANKHFNELKEKENILREKYVQALPEETEERAESIRKIFPEIGKAKHDLYEAKKDYLLKWEKVSNELENISKRQITFVVAKISIQHYRHLAEECAKQIERE